MKQFIEKHSKRICGVLSGLDRVRFCGTFRNLAVPVLLMKWLSHRNVLLKDFKSFVEGLTASLKGAIEGHAAAKGRTVQSLQSSAISKEDLAKELIRRDNCLARVDDVERAQSLLDEQPWLLWSDLLTGLVLEVCPPLLELPYFEDQLAPYWSADETEYATDVIFRSAGELAELYPSLLRHSMTTFGSQQVLRIETTINDTRDFRVFRTAEGEQPDAVKRWLRLRKGVVDLPRRCEVSQAANSRYLTAQASVDVATPLGEITDRRATPVISRGHRSRGLNPMSGIDAELVAILLKGEFCINGFRNRDLRDALFGPTADPAEHRRQSGRITSLLRLFVDHGLVCKVAKTHRYQLSAEGRRLLPSFATARAASTQKLAGLTA